MSAAAGAAFARPLRGADLAQALLQTASCAPPAYCDAAGRKGSSRPHPHRAFAASKRKSVLGEPDWACSGSEHHVCSRLVSEPKSCLPLMPRSRVREGGAESESKGSNPSFGPVKRVLKTEPSLLLSLVQEIQPLDVSQISKEVSSDSTDAMKRTISGMLGLLPSDQFHVTVETSREPLGKLFVSSMMTGYTLRNAEYRLCLQKSLEFSGDDRVGGKEQILSELHVGHENANGVLEALCDDKERHAAADITFEGSMMDDAAFRCLRDASELLESISDDARLYIQHLQQKLASVAKELEECKRINTGLQVQSLVGEEKNDLLDYLRSLSPEKVVELSQPTSPEVEDVIQQVIKVLLDSPLSKLQHKRTEIDDGKASALGTSWQDDGLQKLSSAPLQSQSTVSVNRDHLARLLFWCMLLGHHMRGLEYRLELSRTLSLSGDLDSDATNG